MSNDKIEFYNIEAEHLADLEGVARALYAATGPMSRSELYEYAFKLMAIVNFAKTLHTFQTTTSPKYVHLNSRYYEVTELDVGKTFVNGGQVAHAEHIFVIDRCDIGKRVYTHDGVTRMESDDERATRISRDLKEKAGL